MPFLDMAYQGFADGIDADAVASPCLLQASGLQFFASSSFSKNFSLYGERVGALSVVTAWQGRVGPRHVAGQARHPYQLFQPADPWRRPGSRGVLASDRAARPVGSRTGRHA